MNEEGRREREVENDMGKKRKGGGEKEIDKKKMVESGRGGRKKTEE